MKHFIVRIFDETSSIDEVESREAQAQAFEEETGGRSRILTIAALDDAGNSGSKHFANHRPGRLPGVLVVLAAGAAAIEHFASMEGLVDKLNAMEMGEGFAFVICSNGSIYPRNLTPVEPGSGPLTLTQVSDDDLDIGDLLAGHPDDKASEAAAAHLLDGAVPEDKEIDSAPATGASTDAEAAPATSETSEDAAAQDAPPSAQDAPPPQASGRKGRGSQASTSAGEA